MTSRNTILLLVFLIILAGIAGAVFWTNSSTPETLGITTFTECVGAGNAVMESYPRQCRTASGQLFVEDVATTTTPISTSTPTATNSQFIGTGCALAGCSNVVCTEADSAPGLVTTCIYKTEYACYKTARCEKQSGGKCGWTQTPTLLACLVQSSDSTEPTAL